MKELEIRLSSVQEVQDFVDLSTTRPFPIFVRDKRRQVSGKSFMEMFCLTFNQPITVAADCTEEEWDSFRADIRRFAAEL